jgi:hypothetical protein
MKKFLTIAAVTALALSFGTVAFADEWIPVITDQNRELGVVLSGSFTAHDAGMKTAMGTVYPRYADFPTIADLKNRELGTVLSNAFIHDTSMKGAAAGGLGAEKAVKDSFDNKRIYLGPGGSDLP